eukprot:363918-Chlamydomonas_euryale.AAC.8
MSTDEVDEARPRSPRPTLKYVEHGEVHAGGNVPPSVPESPCHRSHFVSLGMLLRPSVLPAPFCQPLSANVYLSDIVRTSSGLEQPQPRSSTKFAHLVHARPPID